MLTLLEGLRRRLSLTTGALTFVVAVIAVELAGGLAPSVLESIAGSLLASFCLVGRATPRSPGLVIRRPWAFSPPWP